MRLGFQQNCVLLTLHLPEGPRQIETRKASEASSNTDSSANSSNGQKQDKERDEPKRQGPWRPWGWLSRLATTLSLAQPLRIVLNLALLFFLIRLWPLGGRINSAENSQSIVVVVPFSEFMQQVNP